MNDQKPKEARPKSSHAEREERILSFWKEKGIFEKSLEKESPEGDFVFYEGPPTANGRPGIHHLEARAFKDAIPRYKTMRGFHVRRKGGWDTHGLPVELQVEKELGFKSKKDIDAYGIAAFNDKCKESVWKYVHEWEGFTGRMGYWVDLKDPYITYKPDYMEALWGIVKTVADSKTPSGDEMLYKDFRVVPWCPRDQTVLSSHELAQGYEDVKDLAVTVKFKLVPGQKIGDLVIDDETFILAWTTTPWTLPGNVGLAVGKDIEYVEVTQFPSAEISPPVERGHYIPVTKDTYLVSMESFKRLSDKFDPVPLMSFKGSDLIGLSYEPLYPFLKDNVSGPEKKKLMNAYKVYPADFVTTTDGTGIVHTAVMYGQDDFELGTKVGLPKHHLVNEDGTFKKEAGFLAGKFVKDQETDVAIIKDLAARGLLFAKERYQHSYPHCWRCHTPLIYFARDSWYIRMSALRDQLVAENESIAWEPEHIKEGRFGEWLREVKDWAISRERYWGTPLPVWVCEKCHERTVAGSVADVSKKPCNTYFVMRHGEAENNTLQVLDAILDSKLHLTEKGRKQALESAKGFKVATIDLIITSPILRTKETAEIIRQQLGLKPEQVVVDTGVREYSPGIFEGKPLADLVKACSGQDRYIWQPEGGEDYKDVKKRMGDFLYRIDAEYEGKNILVVSHETPLMLLVAAARGMDVNQTKEIRKSGDFMKNAEIRPLDFTIVPHNADYELDLHRPYIDEVTLTCSCGGEMTRVKEVMDVWFDSGAMPFAQDHRIRSSELEAGSQKKGFLSKLFMSKDKLAYPADFISEAIDQTRGWFYTLHAIGILMGMGKAYKNVICLGHILDPEGKKMSKSIGNVVDPWAMMDTYGADALRFWMYSVNQPGDSKNFDEKTVDEVVKKVFNLTLNVLSFYEMYAKGIDVANLRFSMEKTPQPLDRWIVARLDQLISAVSDGLDAYKFMEPTRAVRDFVADLSQWYLRRSRERFKGDDEDDMLAALAVTRYVLLELSKVLAPFTPFLAEEIYRRVGGELESVHLEAWPYARKIDEDRILLLSQMAALRKAIETALSLRSFGKKPARQPLARLEFEFTAARPAFPEDLLALIRDEVNVKEAVQVAVKEKPGDAILEKDGRLYIESGGIRAALDIRITPELKEEGELRELLRKIQDARKEKGLSIGDDAILVVTEDLRSLVNKYEAQIKKATNLTGIESGQSFGLT